MAVRTITKSQRVIQSSGSEDQEEGKKMTVGAAGRNEDPEFCLLGKTQ